MQTDFALSRYRATAERTRGVKMTCCADRREDRCRCPCRPSLCVDMHGRPVHTNTAAGFPNACTSVCLSVCLFFLPCERVDPRHTCFVGVRCGRAAAR